MAFTNKIKIHLVAFFLMTGIYFPPLFSQDLDSLKINDLFNMPLNDFLNVTIVSASKTEQHIKEAAATVHVITAEQIKERGYFTLEEALSDLPGFQFRNTVGFNSYVFMRGAPSQNNLILLLVDGVQINELNSGGFYAGGQFNLSTIDRIEVIYGPASALYGTNALSGIINIITLNPKESKRNHVSILGGNFNTAMADFNLTNYHEKKDIGYSISGMYKTSEKADLRGENGDNNWTNEMENFENDLSLSMKLNIKDFDAGIVYQEKRSSNTTYNKSIGEKYLDQNTLWDIAFLNGFVKYSNTRNEKWKEFATLYYRNATLQPNTVFSIEKATDTTSGKQVGYYRPNQLIGFENQLNYYATDYLVITGGIVGEAEQLSDGFSITNSISETTLPPRPQSPNMINNYLFSYYLQGQVKIFKSLSFTGGFRHDFSSYYKQVLTPRAGLVFNNNQLTIKLLYGDAFRAAKPWDYNYGIGNNNLKPEKMHSLEFNSSYIINNNLLVGVSAYKNLIDNKLIKDTLANSNRWINKNELNTYGIDIYSNYSLKKTQIYANYTYSSSYEQDGIIIPEISMHTANLGLTYSVNSHFKLNLRANFIGERENPNIIPTTGNTTIDDALLFHTCISYFDLKKFDLQLKVSNLLNQEYYHPATLFEGRYRQPQRTITFKISYNF